MPHKRAKKKQPPTPSSETKQEESKEPVFATSKPKPSKSSEPRICKYFARGRPCNAGDKCPWPHAFPPKTDAPKENLVPTDTGFRVEMLPVKSLYAYDLGPTDRMADDPYFDDPFD